MLIAQITDFHVAEPGRKLFDALDTGRALARAIERLNRLPRQPDAVVMTGDLVNWATAPEYDHLRTLLAPLKAPYYVLPGNHDDRDQMRRAFADHDYLPAEGPFLHYAVDLGLLRLIALDTLVPGRVGGRLCDDGIAWLEDQLAAASGRPTLIAMHHPPVPIGIPFMDRIGLEEPEAFARLVRANPNVERILCGHAHRSVQVRLGATIVTVCPSTAHQLALALDAGDAEAWVPEPPAIQLHLWSPETGVVTHAVPIVDGADPVPLR